MSEMIERVAAAIEQAAKDCEISNLWKACSIAAIAAMREPTKAMCKAGSEQHMVSNLEEEAKIKYQWMIDEALKKK